MLRFFDGNRDKISSTALRSISQWEVYLHLLRSGILLLRMSRKQDSCEVVRLIQGLDSDIYLCYSVLYNSHSPITSSWNWRKSHILMYKYNQWYSSRSYYGDNAKEPDECSHRWIDVTRPWHHATNCRAVTMRRWLVHKINKLDMSEVGLCPFMLVLLNRKCRDSKLRLKIATAILYEKFMRGGYRCAHQPPPPNCE
jgi:hypothetical protein